MADLRTIEGGRSIAARDMQASFSVEADTLQCAIPNLAGFVLVAWDDEGNIQATHHLGVRNPYSPAMIPDLIRNRAAHDIMGTAL